MRTLFGISSGAILLLALGACGGGMDIAECRAANWRAIGYEDGVNGNAAGQFGEARKACAKHGIRADFDAYNAGRAEGLVQFCRPRNGFRLGSTGFRYNGTCPAGLEEAFVQAHADGYGLYERQVAVRRIEKKLRYSRERAQSIEYAIVEKTAQVVAPQTLPDQRATSAVDLKQLVEEKVRLEADIGALERDREQAKYEYAYYQDMLTSRQSY